MPLTRSKAKTQGVAQTIHDHMDFGGEAPSAASQSLLAVSFSAPAAQLTGLPHTGGVSAGVRWVDDYHFNWYIILGLDTFAPTHRFGTNVGNV